MTGDEIARQFDDRPGYRLVDYEEVGLPIYRIVSTVLTLQPKAYSPIEEFVLRAIHVGLSSPDDIAGFLGINRAIVEGTASSLIREDEVVLDQVGDLHLTPKSEGVLNGEQLIRPREHSLVFWVDGLTRKPTRTDELPLLQPKFLRDRGIREIRPFPAQKPAAADINAEELQTTLRTATGGSEPVTQILQVKSIEKAMMHFAPAHALIFCSQAGNDIQVAFVIDGRLSEAHEAAFAASGGPARMGIEAAILKPDRVRDDSGLNLPIGPVAGKFDTSQRRREQAIERFKERVTSNEASAAASPEGNVEMMGVYDHPPLLRQALTQASQRLIIVSPWITDAVVDRRFLGELAALLKRGVNVHIGYGLGEDAGRPPKAVGELKKLAGAHKNFTFVRLGDTHAKILIKDNDWLVTTSFNWLSFRGDPKRTFREEWGTKVAMRPQVEEYAERLLQRFARASK